MNDADVSKPHSRYPVGGSTKDIVARYRESLVLAIKA